jgi:hypothetical protein
MLHESLFTHSFQRGLVTPDRGGRDPLTEDVKATDMRWPEPKPAETADIEP